MPRIIEYTENEGSAQTSASTFINLINSSKNATAGLSGFQIKTIVVSSVSAVIFGQATTMVAASILGPGIFLCSLVAIDSGTWAKFRITQH